MRKEVSGMFSLAVLETENEKIAAAIARVFKKNSGKNNISVLILSSDRYAFFKACEFDLLVISPNARLTEKTDLNSGCILIPGTLLDSLNSAGADYAITYGMSPRDTVTASSISDGGIVVTLQRELVTLSGEILERQDLPKLPLKQSAPEKMMSVLTALLLLGVPPDGIRL
jgi:hypothetical protein